MRRGPVSEWQNIGVRFGEVPDARRSAGGEAPVMESRAESQVHPRDAEAMRLFREEFIRKPARRAGSVFAVLTIALVGATAAGGDTTAATKGAPGFEVSAAADTFVRAEILGSNAG